MASTDTGGMSLMMFKVDADVVRNFCGIAMDIGSSAAKLVYRTKASWDEVNNKKDVKRGTLQMLVCGRDKLDEALDKVKQDLHTTSSEEGKKAKAIAIGIGCYQYLDKIQDALNIELNIIFELDCMYLGFYAMLDQCASAESIYPKLVKEEKDAWDKVNENIKAMMQLIDNNTETELGRNESILPPCQDAVPTDDRSLVEILGQDVLYPCMMAFLGSAYGYSKMLPDKSSKVLDTPGGRGGRYFMGIASMLTGCKSYDEFIDMAEKGNNYNIDDSKNSIARKRERTDSDKNPYAAFFKEDPDNDMVIFNFGQTVFEDRSKFKCEDLALSWLHCHIANVCHDAYIAARTAGLRYIFVAGNLCNREFVRKLLTERFTVMRLGYNQNMGKADIEPELVFLKHGGLLGAFGAVLKDAEDRKPKQQEISQT